LARLSAGEFVIQAKVVKRLGVDFFHQLNGGLLPSLKGLRGFSMGGFADGLNRSMSQLSIPRFASGGFAVAQSGGGAAAARTPINLFLPGNDQPFPMLADNDVTASLHRVAVKAGLLSTGRKPTRK
jgi:hypothetical protein